MTRGTSGAELRRRRWSLRPELGAWSFDAVGTGFEYPAALVLLLHIAPEVHGLKVPSCCGVAAVDQGNDVVEGWAERMSGPQPEHDLFVTPGADRAGYAVPLDQPLPWPA